MARRKPVGGVVAVARAKRLVRPLVAKIHALTDLGMKHPAKLVFDCTLWAQHPPHDLVGSDSAYAHMAALKPYLLMEAYDSYVEIFAIFRNIVTAVAGLPGQYPSDRPWTLAQAAALKVGKLMALGTKSLWYSLSQTVLFDLDSVPAHLRKHHDELAGDIDEWLAMDPAPVMATHRDMLVLGYVLHVLVLHLSVLLYALVPVVVHWLHEQGSRLLQTLFVEYWLHLPYDRDLDGVRELLLQPKLYSDLEPFWALHHTGYWANVVSRLKLRPMAAPTFSAYDAFLIDSLAATDKLALRHVRPANLYAVMARNAQYPQNTKLLMCIIERLVLDIRRRWARQTTSLEAYLAVYNSFKRLQSFCKAWLSLRHDCLFNSLDAGNHEMFATLQKLVAFLRAKYAQVMDYLAGFLGRRGHKVTELSMQFEFLHHRLNCLGTTCAILQAFFLDYPYRVPEDVSDYFVDFVADNSDASMVGEFIAWLDENPLPEATALRSLLLNVL